VKRYIKSVVKSVADESPQTQLDLIRNPDTSTRTLDELAHALISEGAGDRVYEALIKHPNTSADTLRYLFSYFGNEFAVFYVDNPNVPDDILLSVARQSGAKYSRMCAR
jgi:hypothetical protein